MFTCWVRGEGGGGRYTQKLEGCSGSARVVGGGGRWVVDEWVGRVGGLVGRVPHAAVDPLRVPERDRDLADMRTLEPLGP